MDMADLKTLDPDVYMTQLKAEHEKKRAERLDFLWEVTRPLTMELALLGI